MSTFERNDDLSMSDSRATQREQADRLEMDSPPSATPQALQAWLDSINLARVAELQQVLGQSTFHFSPQDAVLTLAADDDPSSPVPLTNSEKGE